MTDIEKMGRLAYELRELTKPQQQPGRIHQIREKSDELWNLWLEHYAQYWHHSSPPEVVIIGQCACGNIKAATAERCDRCQDDYNASEDHYDAMCLARGL